MNARRSLRRLAGFMFGMLGFATVTTLHFHSLVGTDTDIVIDIDSLPSIDTVDRPLRSSFDNRTSHCEWKHKGTLKQCFRVIQRKLRRSDGQPSLDRSRPWVFFGDSTMRHLFDAIVGALHDRRDLHVPTNLKLHTEPQPQQQLRTTLDTNTTLLRISNDRCGSLEYFFGTQQTETAQSWVPPNHSNGEGPAAYGLSNPFCSDAAKCYNQLHSVDIRVPDLSSRPNERSQGVSAGTGRTFHTTLEFITVEFALDVTLPTATTRTTQETVVKYLRHQYNGTSATCIVNTGVHDMAIPNITTPIYIRNVRRYLHQLLPSTSSSSSPPCQRILWISLSSTKNQQSRPQRNWKLKLWNREIWTAIQQSHHLRDRVVFIDVWHKSSKTKHVDNVHLISSDYYDPFAQLFLNLTLVSALGSFGATL